MKGKMRMIYFTSDCHFGHENAVSMCNRPFSNVEEMNSEMIRRWNAKVKGNDTVFIVGDMFYRCNDAETILKKLKGKKHLVVGNHDGSWMSDLDMSQYFEGVDNLYEFSDGKRGITLCHYPMLTWKHAKKNYMIHGHIHADTSADYWPLLKIRNHVLNAGVDINNYEPVTFEELLTNNSVFKNEH